MANKKSAEKRARNSRNKRANNKRMVSRAKTCEGEILYLAQEGDKSKAQALQPKLQACVDKAAKTGAISPNKAARVKSRVARAMKEVTPATAVESEAGAAE